jgi:hypothetical protein
MRCVTPASTILLAVLLSLGACTNPSSGDDNDGSGDGDGDGDPGDGDTGDTGDTGDGDGAPGDGDGDGDTGSGGKCQLWLDGDCGDPNQKCMPWSELPDRIPDSTKCCPLDSSPVSLGERCNATDYDGSCLDNCPSNTMCVIDRLSELEGYCQTFCEPGNPNSCGPNEICKSFFEMIESAETVPLCMSRCDPLLQDCASKGRPGWSCLPEGALSPSFLCMPPTESPKKEFESCLLANDCEVGLACVPASEVLGCNGLFNCCTQFCDLSDPMAVCTMGNECLDLESDVPGLEHVGVCADPF